MEGAKDSVSIPDRGYLVRVVEFIDAEVEIRGFGHGFSSYSFLFILFRGRSFLTTD